MKERAAASVDITLKFKQCLDHVSNSWAQRLLGLVDTILKHTATTTKLVARKQNVEERAVCFNMVCICEFLHHTGSRPPWFSIMAREAVMWYIEVHSPKRDLHICIQLGRRQEV